MDIDKPLDNNRASTARATPKDFFLWVGAMLSLFGSIIAFLALLFDYINHAFPDPLAYYATDPYAGGVSYEMASFIILGTACIILLRVIHRSIGKDATRANIWVRRWALYLTLFIAGTTIVIDLIVLLTSFLNGEELTVRFLLKVLIVFLTASAGFMHFLADLRDYWMKNPNLSMRVSWGMGVLGVLTIVAGFLIIGTPWQARQYRLDEQKVNDLTNIQYQIVNYWQQKQKLPDTLTSLSDSISGYVAPTDAQTGQPYRYTKSNDPKSFALCATFNAPNYSSQSGITRPVMPGSYGQDNWSHGKGDVCFVRTIDPQRYPPLIK